MGGLFLCYFIGFFGISFVDADEIVRQDLNASSLSVEKSSRSAIIKSSICIDETIKTCSSVKKSAPAQTKTNKSVKKVVHSDVQTFSDVEIAELVVTNQMKDHELEKHLDPHRAVVVRRLAFESKLNNRNALDELPHEHVLDYSKVLGANCEIVVGYVPIP